MATFNPYKEAAGDAAMLRNATRKLWRGWCCKCNTEKPMAGGTLVVPKGGKGLSPVRGGVVQRFVCAECLAKRAETPNVVLSGARTGLDGA